MQYFFVYAGIAFELLGKAVLARIHPSLITDGKDFDSLLQMCGASSHSKKAPGNIRTIGATEVLKRVKQILPKINSYEKGLKQIIDLRNGYVHLGSVENVDLSDVTALFLKASSILLVECGQNPDIFYEVHSEFVTTILSESTNKLDILIAKRISQARNTYQKRNFNYDDSITQHIAETLNNIHIKANQIDKYDWVNEHCPACEHLGILAGGHDVGWVQDGDDWNERIPIVTIYADHFECLMCNLELDGHDEIVAANLPVEFELYEVELMDFYEPDYELDDDY